MDSVPRMISTKSPRAGTPRHSLVVVGALTSLLCICVPVTPSAAQVGSSSAPAATPDPQPDTRALVAQLDRLNAENREPEAAALLEQLRGSRTEAVMVGLELLASEGLSSELTVRSICALAAEEVPVEMSTLVLDQVVSSPTLDDWTKRSCIRSFAKIIDASFLDLLLQFALDPEREINLRVSALLVATSRWPLESRPTLVQLLESAQDPVMHHKALQYLAGFGDPDDLPLIEQFVLNRDPATAGKALSKEYGLLILRSRAQEDVIPLLDSILRDGSWPEEVHERTIDLLANSELAGGPAVLRDARIHVGAKVRSRIDAALTERE